MYYFILNLNLKNILMFYGIVIEYKSSVSNRRMSLKQLNSIPI